MATRKITGNELNWQTEEDARILGRYQEILDDRPRLNRALKKAKEQADNLQERANSLSRSVSRLKGSKKR